MRPKALHLIIPIVAVLGIGAVSNAPLRAQEAGLGNSFGGMQLDGGKPISIESGQLDVNDKEGVATFTGSVQVDQGETQLRTGKLIVYYDKDSAADGGKPASATPTGAGPLGGGSNEISKLEASDKVYVKSADQVATSDKATFDMKSQLVVMTGNVVLSQGKNVAEGCSLTIHMDTGLARLESDGCGGRSSDGGRIKMMLTPSDNPKPQASN